MKNQTIVRAHKTCLLTMQGFRTGSSSQMTLENLALSDISPVTHQLHKPLH